jgi:hypothetical protein
LLIFNASEPSSFLFSSTAAFTNSTCNSDTHQSLWTWTSILIRLRSTTSKKEQVILYLQINSAWKQELEI